MIGNELPASAANVAYGTAAEIENSACPVCETLANIDAEYFARAFGESRRFAVTSEAVTDALGFCSRHGSTLLSQEHLPRGLVRVFRGAIPRLVPVLAEKYLYEDRVQQVLFGASSSCPACAYGNRAAARHARRLARQFSSPRDHAGCLRLDSLCVRHFQLLAGDFKPEVRLPAFTQYGDALDHAATATEDLLESGRLPGARRLEEGSVALHHALELIAGRPAQGQYPDGDALAEALQCCPTLVEGLVYPKACPLCLEVGRARRRWIHDVPVAAKFKQIAWLFFPTCPEHIWPVVQLGDPQLTAMVVTHALHVAIGQIYQQILTLVRAAEINEERAQEAARFARWGKRRRRRKKVAQEPAMPRLVRCPGCERLAVAEDHATKGLLDLLQERKYRNAFNRGYGLCMKHFAQVYLMAPKGMLRATLAEDQRARLNEFTRVLDEKVRAMHDNRMAVPKELSWTMALHRFCGFA
jgi:hypothetical protein